MTDVGVWERELQAEIIGRMSEGVILLARDGTILFANAAIETTLGYAPGELVGTDAHRLSFRTREAFDGLLQTGFEATANGSSAPRNKSSTTRVGFPCS